MRCSYFLAFSAAVVLCLLTALVVYPEIDLSVGHLFANFQTGFVYAHTWPVQALGFVAYYGARVLGIVLAAGALIAVVRKKPLYGLTGKAWLFLLIGLILGPGLIANTLFKDNWGRARPRDVIEFGGRFDYKPPLFIHHDCEKNCSFVSGDAAFGFYLPALAYVVSSRRSRKVLGLGILAGFVFGGARIVGGAHFLSDVLFSAFFMFSAIAVLHGFMFGWKETAERWRLWLAISDAKCACAK